MLSPMQPRQQPAVMLSPCSLAVTMRDAPALLAAHCPVITASFTHGKPLRAACFS